jgi:RHS repeat-associated protein
VGSRDAPLFCWLGGKLIATSENGTIRYIHQDSLTSTSLMTDSTGNQIGTTVKYLPFGETKMGSVPTDKLFTGQRLDGTGLYYYNARYYDPTIGRFISADTIIPDINNPQSYNRYSYCINNPIKYLDPNGHDYLLVGGSGSTAAEMKEWKDMIVASGVLSEGEQVYTLYDNDPESVPFQMADVAPRYAQLDAWLSNPTDDAGNSVKVTDLKIMGHSEGAATTGTYIADWLDGSNKVSKSSAGLLDTQLKGVFLLDCPTGISGDWVLNYDYTKLNDVGEKLTNRGIKAADIYNSCGPIHAARLSGWDNYSVASWNDYFVNSFGLLPWLANIKHNHTSTKQDSISVVKNIVK